MTVSGQNVEYPDDVGTSTAKGTATKVLINSTLSLKHAKFMTLDIKNMYLQTLLDSFEDMKIPHDLMPDKIKQQ